MAETTTNKRTSTAGLSADERAAVRERAKELKAAANKEEGLKDLLAKIAEMPAHDRVIAERIHAIVGETAPDLEPKTYYGMPAYAKDGDTICWFKPAAKFKMRYGELQFSDKAKLDDGAMWPDSFALKELTPAVEKEIAALVKKAVS